MTKNSAQPSSPIDATSSSRRADKNYEIDSIWQEHGQKIFFFVIAIILGVWFFNEYRNTKTQLLEEASTSYSQLVTSLPSVLEAQKILSGKGEAASPEKLGHAENEVRLFLDNIKRLKNDYPDTEYATMGSLLEGAFYLASGLSDKTLSVLEQSTSAAEDNSSISLPSTLRGLQRLLVYRAYISKGKGDPLYQKGIDGLTSIIALGSFFAPEAAKTLALSSSSNPEILPTLKKAVADLQTIAPDIYETTVSALDSLATDIK